MAVLQISKIQVRRGKESETNVPALSAGEFAWSIDVQKLYIGNGAVSEGAPQVGNTEIVTFTNNSINRLFSEIPFYTYGTQITTANKLPTSVLGTRPIFRKLDDTVSTADYGTQGDFNINTGIGSDDTKSLQDAIIKTFLASDNTITSSRKTLRIPAGTYQVTGTIYIPPYTTIEGDGVDKTIIALKKSAGGVPIFQFCGIDQTALGTGLDRISTYPNIKGSISLPTNINISNMTLTYATPDSQNGDPDASAIVADTATNSEIKNVKIKGIRPSTASGIAGINIRGLDTTAPKNLKITNCHFEKVFAGISSRYNASDISIQNNKFYDVVYGVWFNNNLNNPGNFPPGLLGPQYVDISHNNFELTYYQAISVEDPNGEFISSYVSSNHNTFVNCGNGTGDHEDQVQQTPVISFDSLNNSSVNDYFSRFEGNNSILNAPTIMYPCVSGIANIQSTAPIAVDKIQSPVLQPILTVAKQTGANQTININYVATQTGISRRGVIKVVSDDISPVVSEEYTYNGMTDGGFTFAASITTASNALTISILNPQAETQLIYQFNQLY